MNTDTDVRCIYTGDELNDYNFDADLVERCTADVKRGKWPR